MRLNRNVWFLGITSFLNDVASEATLRLLPLFLSQVLGAGTPVIGLIEGVADSTATLTRLVSGWISDRLPRRKPLVVAGYALSGLTKPFLLLATHWSWVLFIRFADRLGKGLRSAPRDALVADEAHSAARGASFGLLRALDTLGALTGLGMAYFIVRGSPSLTRPEFSKVVLLALIPAFAAVAVVALKVREAAVPGRTSAPGPAAPPGLLHAIRALPRPFLRYLGVISLFTLANSSDAFLVLLASRSRDTGAGGVGFALLCLMALNLTSSAISVPAGRLSDRLGRKAVVVLAWMVYALAYAGFGLLAGGGPVVVLVLFLFYGAFAGLHEGAEKAWVADLVEQSGQRGMAYGVFGFAVGVMSLPASLVFGIIWEAWGEKAAFLSASGAAALATVLLVFLVPEKPGRPRSV